MTRRALHLSLCLALAGCFQGGWRDVGDGATPGEGTWYATGVVSFVGPTGVAVLADRGAELLSSALGASLAVSVDGLAIPPVGTLVETEPLMLRPAGLAILPAGEADVLRLLARFHPVGTQVQVSVGPVECALSVALGEPAVEVILEARRDVAGHIALVAREDGVIPTLGGLTVTPGKACSAAWTDDIAQTVSEAVADALSEALSDRPTVVAHLERLGHKLTGAGAPGRLSGGTDSGFMGLVVTPNSIDGEEPILQSADGALVLPLRVGLEASPAACAADLPPLPAPGAVTPTPALDFSAAQAHVAWVVRLDLIEAAVHAYALAGELCLRPGHTGAALTLGMVRDHLPPADVALADETPVTIRFRPTAAPSVSVQAGTDPLVRVTVASAEVELYVRLWQVDYHLWAGPLQDLEVAGRLTLDPAGTLRLAESAWTASGEHGAGLAQVVRVALGADGQAPPLLPLPRAFPYPLGHTEIAREGDRLVIFARFRDDAPVRDDLAAAVTPPPPAAGCAAARTTSPDAGVPWLTLMAAGLWWYRRRRAVELTASRQGGIMRP